MRLHEIKPAVGSRKKKRIVGRGEGSTLGQTCGKGQKGQTCRSGDGIMNGFEGGQMPLYRRLPKRGFNHSSKIHYQPINIVTLEKQFEAGAEINGQTLYDKGLLENVKSPYKVLGAGELKKSLKIIAKKFSKSAQEAVSKAGGSISPPK